MFRIPRNNRLKHLSIKRVILVPLIYILLGLNRFIILGMPFKLIANKLGKSMVMSNVEMDPQNHNRVMTISQLIRLLSPHTPWQSKCFVQALTAKEIMNLLKIPSTVYFGLARADDGSLIAHAWVTYGEFIVTGSEGHEKFKVVAYYG
jgi:hypothetical protein